MRKKLGFKGGKVATVDATTISLETIKAPKPNTAMMGALIKVMPLVELGAIEDKIKGKFLKKIGEEKTQANIDAIRRAYNEVKVG